MTVLDQVIISLILSSFIWKQVSGAVYPLLYRFTGLQRLYPGISRHSSSQLRWQAIVLVYDYLGTFLQVCLLLVRRGQFQAQREDFHEQKSKKKHFVHQKVEVFWASDPILTVFMWGINHTVCYCRPLFYI